jgi:hypothetical protein
LVENPEQRGRSIYSKHELLLFAQQHDRINLPPLKIINSQSSKSNENIQQKDSLITKSEDKQQANLDYIPFNESEIRRFQLVKEKFEHKQPIDIVFGMKKILKNIKSTVRVQTGQALKKGLLYHYCSNWETGTDYPGFDLIVKGSKNEV